MTSNTDIDNLMHLFMRGQYDEVVQGLRALRPDLSEQDLTTEFLLSSVKVLAEAYTTELETTKRLREEIAEHLELQASMSRRSDDHIKQIRELTDAFPSTNEIVSRAEALRDKLVDRLREEAGKYPGNDLEDSPCESLDEKSCLAAHLHEFVSIDGEIKIIVGSPERIAKLALQFILPLLAEPR